MSLDLTAVLGLIAGCLTTVSLVPQAWKVWRSRSAKDISLKMFIAFASGVRCGSFTA
jgi:MtN3 and saliva related transmembrane protein